MADNTTIGQKLFSVISVTVIALFMVSGGALAKIPEPDNIIYGIAGDDVVTVSLQINGQQIASYTMGANPAAGEFYILRVPLDSLDPPEPGSAHVGDEASIFINDGTTPAATVFIGERGSIQKVHLGGEDSDMDGLLDGEEEALGTNPRNRDSDGDGLSDAAEVAEHHTNPLLSDSDADGYSDRHEISASTNPLDKDELPVVYVDAGNTSGIEQGTTEYPFQTIARGIDESLEKYVVLVASGTYNEAVIIDKDIKLIGDSPSTTVIDANDTIAVDCDYTPAGEEIAGIERFMITNADVGIQCRQDTSPLIRNNIITGMADVGISCENPSNAEIISNTIVGNATATAIQSDSPAISIINNIISDNLAGIDCEGEGLRIDYNNLWNSTGGDDYVGLTLSGVHDIATYPSFAGTNDFHLLSDSLCLDAGDPVETLTGDYTGGSELVVDETTNLAMDDRIRITDGTNMETHLVSDVTSTTIDIPGQFMNSYLAAHDAFIFTDTSDASKEPDTDTFRIDMGAYGNTEEAGPKVVSFLGDLDNDSDVDGKDLAVFADDLAAGLVDESDLEGFAANFGK